MRKNPKNIRIEKDSMGNVNIPKNALYGPQTQRAVDNFKISNLVMPKEFIIALLDIKRSAAQANKNLRILNQKKSNSIIKSIDYLKKNYNQSEFPVDVFQTGSGTSTNMNVNEVISNISRKKYKTIVHPNDDVNLCQSSNDVIPSAISISCARLVNNNLLPAMTHLSKTINKKSKELKGIAKTGRTHLMDAMPLTFEQELASWKSQVDEDIANIKVSLNNIKKIPIGGTAIGSGINAHKNFAKEFIKSLSLNNGFRFYLKNNKFTGLSFQNDSAALSSSIKLSSITLTKISNDLRWMNSGPLSGLGEISLTALQPGSSIMPGKVNPVIPESVLMACTKILGNDLSVNIAASTGSFQLNVMLPLIAYNTIESIYLLSNSSLSLADKAISGFKVNKDVVSNSVSSNPILVTALNKIIGYEKGALIAKRAYIEGRDIIDIAAEETDLSEKELEKILNPIKLTFGGL